MLSKIPYVISEAHPDYKRPYLFDNFGSIDENIIDTFFVETVSEFILDRKDINTISSITDIEDFWNYYYQEYYMENAPWTAMIFINGNWKSITPSNIEPHTRPQAFVILNFSSPYYEHRVRVNCTDHQ